ncbi:sensor histidine kinase [Croceibacterium salegens]|uniref:sensor histidine kinase n=1 Tax=Croceibacterium salegens TaxID=1737568 RepID=UPI00135866A2|nr:sensor histidine kinase [Croceibacterium salegens]
MDRIPFVRRAILADRPISANVGWTALAVLVPALFRWFLDHGTSGVPFITFFPSILLTSVLLGWQYGLATAIVSGVIANRLLRQVPLHFLTESSDALLFVLFAIDSLVIIFSGNSLRNVIRSQDEARVREEALKRELLHRVKNLFTIVQSLAALTARNSAPEEFSEKFGSRLATLGQANDLIVSAGDERADVEALVERAIEPFRIEDNFACSGPHFALPPTAVVPLALALHELCTNAVKYGALSAPEGKVTISWKMQGDDLLIEWTESGGPAVVPPSRQGLGSMLLRPRNSLKDIRLSFAPDGARCSILVTPED